MHVLSITQTGGAVLGHRALELDGVKPWVFIHGNVIQQGFTPVRSWRRSDAGVLPTLSWWGYDVIAILARKHFGPFAAE